ncbi:inositol monophosphatase family protein [Psittacicella hinzii]|nr:inositol monophosphatase family protein [Psittacicella hinzii]
MSVELLRIAKRAAFAAAEVLREGYHHRNHLVVEAKGINDYVSNIDREAEERAIAEIKRARPKDFIVAEETADKFRSRKHKAQGATTWIIDPLDGTRNFIMGNPHFAVSIAAMQNGEIVAAVVFNPISDELYTAVKGGGAFCNDRRLRLTTSPSSLEGKVLTTGYAFKEPKRLERQLAVLPALFDAGMADIRRYGSAALDLCYVAAGRFDGYFEECVKPWDIAAGALIAREAKALVVDFQGGDNYLETEEVIAGKAAVVREVAQVIHRITQAQKKAAAVLNDKQ